MGFSLSKFFSGGGDKSPAPVDNPCSRAIMRQVDTAKTHNEERYQKAIGIAMSGGILNGLNSIDNNITQTTLKNFNENRLLLSTQIPTVAEKFAIADEKYAQEITDENRVFTATAVSIAGANKLLADMDEAHKRGQDAQDLVESGRWTKAQYEQYQEIKKENKKVLDKKKEVTIANQAATRDAANSEIEHMSQESADIREKMRIDFANPETTEEQKREMLGHYIDKLREAQLEINRQMEAIIANNGLTKAEKIRLLKKAQATSKVLFSKDVFLAKLGSEINMSPEEVNRLLDGVDQYAELQEEALTDEKAMDMFKRAEEAPDSQEYLDRISKLSTDTDELVDTMHNSNLKDSIEANQNRINQSSAEDTLIEMLSDEALGKLSGQELIDKLKQKSPALAKAVEASKDVLGDDFTIQNVVTAMKDKKLSGLSFDVDTDYIASELTLNAKEQTLKKERDEALKEYKASLLSDENVSTAKLAVENAQNKWKAFQTGVAKSNEEIAQAREQFGSLFKEHLSSSNLLSRNGLSAYMGSNLGRLKTQGLINANANLRDNIDTASMLSLGHDAVLNERNRYHDYIMNDIHRNNGTTEEAMNQLMNEGKTAQFMYDDVMKNIENKYKMKMDPHGKELENLTNDRSASRAKRDKAVADKKVYMESLASSETTAAAGAGRRSQITGTLKDMHTAYGEAYANRFVSSALADLMATLNMKDKLSKEFANIVDKISSTYKGDLAADLAALENKTASSETIQRLVKFDAEIDTAAKADKITQEARYVNKQAEAEYENKRENFQNKLYKEIKVTKEGTVETQHEINTLTDADKTEALANKDHIDSSARVSGKTAEQHEQELNAISDKMTQEQSQQDTSTQPAASAATVNTGEAINAPGTGNVAAPADSAAINTGANNPAGSTGMANDAPQQVVR